MWREQEKIAPSGALYVATRERETKRETGKR
jgi:hypothetical protein